MMGCLRPYCMRDGNQQPPCSSARRLAALYIRTLSESLGKCVLVRHGSPRPECVIGLCFWMDELVRGLLWLCVCACGFCCWSKQAPNGTKPRGIELLLTTATCVSSPPLSALVCCLALPYRWSYAFASYYHSHVCAYVLSSLATFG